MIRLCCVLLWLVISTSSVAAHALQPGYLELRALGGDSWSVLWRKPDVQGSPMAIDPLISAPCEAMDAPPVRFDGRAWTARWVLSCPGGLQGATITIEGLEATRTDVLIRYETALDEDGRAWRLVPSQTSYVIPENPGKWDVFNSYTGLGVEHILLGADHLLFVLALLLLIPGLRVLVGAITAFTLAHSITLGAAALGWLTIPGPPVEAVIALSIMFVASEILQRDPDNPRLSERAPWLVSFGFGLIHGLGFGSALSEIGLPTGEIVLALLAFNIGVELGQLLFIAAILLAWRILRPLSSLKFAQIGKATMVYAIGGLAAFWLIERVSGFWT